MRTGAAGDDALQRDAAGAIDTAAIAMRTKRADLIHCAFSSRVRSVRRVRLACAGRHIITAYARPPSFGGRPVRRSAERPCVARPKRRSVSRSSASIVQAVRLRAAARAGMPIAKTSVSGYPTREINNMNIFALRKHLRFLIPVQRRRWWDQRKRLTPRVRVGGAYVPPNVSRAFAYAKVG